MTQDSAQNMIDELDTLLDQERGALVDGDLEQLSRLVAYKEDLIGKINLLDSLERGRLAEVHDKVARNQVLLNSAMEGIHAVASRMADLRRVRQGLETYDRTGQKKRFDTQIQSSMEKRA